MLLIHPTQDLVKMPKNSVRKLVSLLCIPSLGSGHGLFILHCSSEFFRSSHGLRLPSWSLDVEKPFDK